LKECGYHRTAAKIKSKINNLKTEYRKMKPKSGSKYFYKTYFFLFQISIFTGDSIPDWSYYSIIGLIILHEILGQRDVCNNDLLEDSLISNEFENNTSKYYCLL